MSCPRDTVDPRSLCRAHAESQSGTAPEHRDFAVYPVAAATIFGDRFIPSGDDLVGTTTACSAYAVGYLARPLDVLTGAGLLLARGPAVESEEDIKVAEVAEVATS